MVLSGAMFSFEKLNRAVGSFGRVPLIAEFMATKWSYEALVVHQFKDNEFHKHFYEIEKVERNADYKNVYFIPELEKYLNESIEALGGDDEESKHKLAIDLEVLYNSLYNEINYLAPGIPYSYLDQLNIKNYSYEVAYATFDYLDDLKKHYNKIFQEANQRRDRLISHLVSTNARLYEAKRKAYHNESISDLVTKKFEKNCILQYKGELVQQNDPIYRDPIPRHKFDFRSHFLAPRKHFLGKYYDTFWFNICFIWIMTAILYIALYFEVLKKIIDFFSKLSLPKFRK